MSKDPISAGYYGKLPLRGDFIQRNVDPEFIQIWDNWLQGVISSSREILGENWLNFYLVSPIWHFYLPINSMTAYCGVMLPSVDKVGRYFPFSIITQVDISIPAQSYIINNVDWFNEAEQLALHALNESIQFEELNKAIDVINETHSNILQTIVTPSANNFRVPLGPDVNLNTGFLQINQLLPQIVSAQVNYWWTAGNEQIAGNLFCSDDLPDDNLYTAMLDGQWQLCHMQTLDTSSQVATNE